MLIKIKCLFATKKKKTVWTFVLTLYFGGLWSFTLSNIRLFHIFVRFVYDVPQTISNNNISLHFLDLSNSIHPVKMSSNIIDILFQIRKGL